MRLFSLLTLFVISLVTFGQQLTYDWAIMSGLHGYDKAISMEKDANGNLYLTGDFGGQGIHYGTQFDFDFGAGVHNLTVPADHNPDTYIKKLDSLGNFVWVKQIKGKNGISPSKVYVDSIGNVFVCGTFGDTADFDPGSGVYNLVATSNSADAFVLKLDSNGNFLWAKSFGGTGQDKVNSIAIGASGEIYLSGTFQNTVDFDPGAGVYNLSTTSNQAENFILKLDSLQNFVWCKQIGNNLYNRVHKVVLDAYGNVYSIGSFKGGIDLDPGSGVQNFFSQGNSDFFIQKLDASGNYVWAKTAGGTQNDDLHSIVIKDSSLYITGNFQGTVDFGLGGAVDNRTSNGSIDGLILKMDLNGSKTWVKTIGGTSADYVREIKIGPDKGVYFLGYAASQSVDFDPGAGSHIISVSGSGISGPIKIEMFVERLDSLDNFDWVKHQNSTDLILGNALVIDQNKKVYVAGDLRGETTFFPGSTIHGGAIYSSIFVFRLKHCATYQTINVAACDSSISPSGNYTWISSGIYQDTIPNAQGCDSVITINLSINNSLSSISIAACSSYVSPSGNYTWTTNGVYQDTVINSLSCDSVITINLSINNSSSSISTAVCSSYVSPSGNYTWTSSGVYQDTIPNSQGCDSIITINLTINNSSAVITPAICDIYTSPSGNHTWISSGTYQDTISNSLGCDSLITINLTVKNSTNSTQSITICDTYTSPSGNYVWTSSGTYQDTIPNSLGCDSVITINLTVKNSTSSTLSTTVCDIYTSPSGNYTWSSSGTYNDTIPNHLGCDSILTINLTINSSTNSTQSITVCDAYTSPSGNYTWGSSGTYQDTISNVQGCDSVLMINLTIKNSTNSSQSITVCDTYTSPSGNYVWTNSGTYQDTISNAQGCDSVLTINLTIKSSTNSTQSVTVCETYTSPSGNHTWTSSGTYQDTISNAQGCDSVVTINLVVNGSSIAYIDKSTCDSLVSPSGNYIWNVSGTYKDTIPNHLGCDSLITVKLTVVVVDTSVSIGVGQLEANAINAQYQWLTCNGDILSGETNKILKPGQNGSYKVKVIEQGCIDTSSCHTITNVGLIENWENGEVVFYPNPTRGEVKVEFPSVQKEAFVSIYNSFGQLVVSDEFTNTDRLQLNINGETGVYFLEVLTEDQKLFKVKMIKL